MNLAEAIAATGGLSRTSKMPCASYGLSALDCVTGSRLREIPNTVCSKCYAMRGNYRFPVPQSAYVRRLATLADLPRWVEGMTYLINAEDETGFFRWHCSGDVQSTAHLEAIFEVARRTPHIQHWLPTKERGFLSKLARRRDSEIPHNLAVRVAAVFIDRKPVPLRSLAVGYSTVHKLRTPSEMDATACPAKANNGKCGICRKCWDIETYPTISYPLK